MSILGYSTNTRVENLMISALKLKMRSASNIAYLSIVAYFHVRFLEHR